MKELLNTLYIFTPGTQLHVESETVRVEVDRETRAQIPMHHLGGLCCFGRVHITPQLIEKFTQEGRFVNWFSEGGRFLARAVGRTSGSVHLRMAQVHVHDDLRRRLPIAKNIVAAKIQNSRATLMRSARDAKSPQDKARLEAASKQLILPLGDCRNCTDLDQLRGVEGAASMTYFGAFRAMVGAQRGDFTFGGRSRRPPRDRVNAMLSLAYALLLTDCISALEGVGLDPQVGMLHSVRAGRPALALDLMEEFRAVVSDRLVLTLINRQQVKGDDFEQREGGGTYLNEQGRKTLVVQYQEKKRREIPHPYLEKQVAYGLLPHLQARLLSRHMRGETEIYPAWLYQ
jgi:CRISPR-associated protein Cas1